MIHKDRRRVHLHNLVKADRERFIRIYLMRCNVREGRTDVERIEEVLSQEYPDERTQEQIEQRENWRRREIEAAERFIHERRGNRFMPPGYSDD